ncbi:MAG: 4Fe-4S dicluster domain-containing protein [Elusimicrobiales bacterium]|nr:4Fe-4S dicluster domain-containing protein [Elusimicrobiales bacterium]
MKYHILDKKNLDSFIKSLARRMKVVGPVKKSGKNYVFKEVKTADEMSLKYIPTILPPKKYLMPEREKILDLKFESDGIKEEAFIENEKIAIFGVHTCDLSGIQCLNIVFNDKPVDKNFLMRKENVFIVGLECNSYCDEYASCGLVNSYMPNGGFDLFFTDLGDKFIINVNTQDAEELVESLKLPPATPNDMSGLDKLRDEKRKIFKNEINVDPHKIPQMFDKVYESKLWEEVGNKCLSCGNCTNVCPTCYCFDVDEKISLDMSSSERIRSWDSCQFETFAKVAGGENFRKERGLRQRHRVYRKFKFPQDKYNRFFCTGCGRCSRTCMAGINLKDILVKVAEESKI